MNARREAFIAAYVECGNGAEAARRAGYSEKTADSQAERLLRNEEIKTAVKQFAAEKLKPTIANAEERQEFWSNMMRDDGTEPQHRLKASELLGKRQGDFLDRVESKVSILIVDESD